MSTWSRAGWSSTVATLLALTGCGARTVLDTGTAPHPGSATPPPVTAAAHCTTPAPKPTVLYEGDNGPDSLALTDDDLYWTSGRAVVALSKCGGAPSTIAQDASSPVTTFSNHAYWVDGSLTLVRADEAGTMETLGPFNAGPIALAVDGERAFALQALGDGNLQLVAAPLGGGPVSVLATDVAADSGFAIDDTSAYVQVGPTYRYQLAKVPKGGGPAQTLTSFTFMTGMGLAVPGNIALDDTAAYWRSTNEGLVRTRKDGAGTQTLSTDTRELIAADGQFVYYFATLQGFQIARIPVGGGAEEDLAPSGSPVAIAVDEGSVYWADTSESAGYPVRVLKLDKP